MKALSTMIQNQTAYPISAKTISKKESIITYYEKVRLLFDIWHKSE